tara:strand:+ start:2550 stop:4955 length:2406 start_codon:yes stop_codon:yes gene_type:complete
MSRISSYASNQQLVGRLLQTQERLLDLQYQVNSEKKSPTYSGIARDSQRLINIENSRDRLTSYISNNEREQTRLNIADTAIEAFRVSINTFNKELSAYTAATPTTRENIDSVQTAAFRALRDFEDLLNTEVDGRFLFSGGRATTEPVDLGVNSVSSFQATYDGAIVKVPETRDANLQQLSVSNDDSNDNSLFIDSSNFLRFRRDSDGVAATTGSSTIEATSAVFANLKAGATITIADTTSNNGTYTVESVSSDGKTATVRTKMLTDETLSIALTNEALVGPVSILLESDTNGTASVVTAGADTTFDAAAGTITDTTAGGQFAGMTAGSFITVSGTTSNNATYKVASIDGTNSVITLEPLPTVITLVDDSTINNSNTGTLTFSRSGNTITAATASAFSNVSAGEVITVAGTDENNGTYTVSSISADGKTITIDALKLTDEGLSGNTFFDLFTNTDVSFNATTSTIEIQRDGAGTAVANAFNGLSVGDKFTVAGATTAANNTTYTIATIASDGSSVTVEEAINTTEVDADGVTFTGSGNGYAYESSSLITYTDATNRITVRNAGDSADITGVFSSLSVGDSIALSGSAGGYDDTYTITAVASDGSYIEVSDANGTLSGVGDGTDAAEVRFQVFGASGSVSSTSYYAGDDNASTHRVDDNRSFEFDIQANDPAFEKAVRAMKLILQGEYGTEGGLDQNLGRINDAKYLLNSALENTVSGTPPFGTELSGSIEQMAQDVGFSNFLIETINRTHTSFIGFLDQSIAKAENADPLETITRLLDDERVLSASYQTYARIRQLSLTNFL